MTVSRLHLTPALIFKLQDVQQEHIPYVLSFDYKNTLSLALQYLDDHRKIISFAGLQFYKGSYRGKKIIVAHGGTYAPDTAIATEILAFLGAKYIIRIGSCGGLVKHMRFGDYVIPTSILDYTGVTRFYQGRLSVPASVGNILKDILESFAPHRGKVCSYDALFQESDALIRSLVRHRCIAIDMALASFFKVSRFCGCHAGALLVVSDNLITGSIGFADSLFHERLNTAVKKVFEIFEHV